MRSIPMLNIRAEYEHLKREIDSAISGCLDHQQWIFGPELARFEEKVASYIGVKHCIGVSSGTDALVLALRALAIKLKGEDYFNSADEIITTAFTFTATGDAILRAGATPVFVDIDPYTKNISAEDIENYLDSSSGNTVVGIIPVHLYGQSCRMDKIMSAAEKRGLFVLEDVAQAFGGMWRGLKLGSLGNAGALSFFPTKNLGGMGDGGMITTNDDAIMDLVRQLLKHGGKDKYNSDYIGYNARLDTLQAAVLLAKMQYIDEFNDRRRSIASLYSNELNGIEGLSLPGHTLGAHHVYHQYTVCTAVRDNLKEYLKSRGISSMVYYPVALHKMRVFSGRARNNGILTNTENAISEVLSLPISPMQKGEDTTVIIESIKNFFDRR